LIVFLNILNKTITICDKVVKTYPWSKIKDITSALEGKEVLYVSEAINVPGEHVIDFIIQDSQESSNNHEQILLQDQELYIHSKTKIKVAANYNGKEYLFKGCRDFVSLSSLPEGMLEKCKMIVEGLKNGLLEIVNSEEKAFLEQQYEDEIETKRESLQRLEDTVKGSLDDPIEIDLSGTGNFKRGKK